MPSGAQDFVSSLRNRETVCPQSSVLEDEDGHSGFQMVMAEWQPNPSKTPPAAVVAGQSSDGMYVKRSRRTRRMMQRVSLAQFLKALLAGLPFTATKEIDLESVRR